MAFFLICLLVLFGLSLLSFVEPRQKVVTIQSKYALPPKDWPDVPVNTLSLFRQDSRINAPMPKTSKPHLRRFQSFDDTQAFIIGLVDKQAQPPKIGLQLSKTNGPDWTDVTFDGRVVAHVQTAALTHNAKHSAAHVH